MLQTISRTTPSLVSRRSARVAATVAASALLVLLVGCASKGVPPIAEMASAKASLSQAESAGALRAAPVELLAAQDKMARAEAAVREEKFDQARRLAVQAEVDAELAEKKSRTVKAQTAAAELARSNEMLREELERKTGR